MRISLLVVVNSSDKGSYDVSYKTIFPFLEHFGIPYQELDLAKEDMADFNVNGILIAQEGIGEKLSEKTRKNICQTVKQGTGLINLDYHLDSWEELHQPLKIEKLEKADKTSFVRIGETHYINQLQQPVAEKTLFQPLNFLKVKSKSKSLLLSNDGSPLLLCSSSPKLIQFLISPRLWDEEYLGFCAGLDRLLLQAIVWAVKKPFIMKAMPPFATARIDDASGSASIFGKRKDSAVKNFAYIDALNKHGYIPAIGIYIDDITEKDGKKIKQKYDSGLAEFSPHAFSDPKNINEFPIYMHHSGEEFSSEELRENFARVDEKFNHWKIKQAKTVNAHFREIGANSLPFLKERGLTCVTSPNIFGKSFVDKESRNWTPKPYGFIKGIGGVIDYHVDAPEFFAVYAGENLGPKGYVAPYSDFLYSCTTFWNENTKNDLERAAERGAKQIMDGIDNGFFGCLLTHEQRIATLSAKEFEKILSKIDKLTSGYKKIFKSYDYIAEYAKSKYDAELMEANYNPASKEMKLKFTGKSTVPLKIYLFNDESCQYEFKEIPGFEGEREFILK